MKLQKVYLNYFSLLVLLMSCTNKQIVTPPEPLYPIPSENQLAWHKMGMNAFIHFSLNTFTNKEWGMGDEPVSAFNPTEMNTGQWVKVLSEVGFKGLILTCKHHDGFCLWPTEYTDYSIKNSPYKNGKGNIVKEVSDSCRKYGMKFGIYVSPWDRNHSHYGFPEYITYYRNQLRELFELYGPVFEMWFDGANGGTGYYGGANETRTIDRSTYYDWSNTISMVRKMEPDVLFFSDAGPDIRWCGNEEGYVNRTNWATITPDTLFPGKAGITELLKKGSPDGTKWIPAEVDVSIRPGWFYHKNEDSLVKTPERLFEIYLTSVGRGAVLLLNIPPDERGLFHENDIAALKGFKAILDSTFKTDIAKGKSVSVKSYRGKSEQFAGKNLTDGDDETYWCTDDKITSNSFEIDFKQDQKIGFIVLQEYFKLGQRVKKFSIEAQIDNQWHQIAEDTTIGYKRILPVDNIKTNRIRINILEAKACPVISNVEIYQ